MVVEGHKLDARGVPSFAQPWVELGRLEEREKWQKLAMELMETSISSELLDLKGTVATTLPGRLPDLKQNINTKVDEAQGRISHLIAQYKKFFLEESSVEDVQNPDRNKIITAQSTTSSQYTALGYGFDGSIWERSAGSTSEIVIEEEED